MGEYGKLYQDQIYGAKVLTPLAVAIIDTPEFQRLDKIRQLGFADVTYRGAKHTRYAHSIGTYFITRTIMRRINQNHQRLDFPHPGSYLSKRFRCIPKGGYSEEELNGKEIPISRQSLWRGASEIVAIAALLHDISHVPFGHTLEDEFAGIYKRHDRLGGHRLYQMLFNEQSELSKVFSDSDTNPKWLPGIQKDIGIKNSELAQLIYVILSWKEEIEPPVSFNALLRRELKKLNKVEDSERRKRLIKIRLWHRKFKREKLFHPFMSDVVGNTICADLLDYLQRDRRNLGMESRSHSRLQRYFTIRPCALHHEEDLRLSILVARRLRGGQRPDVATAVLDVMRERYEMAERVFYHHKKAAASAMLAKLAEVCRNAKPLDTDDSIYPAPWSQSADGKVNACNVVHFSDDSFIDHLGTIETQIDSHYTNELRNLLYRGLRYDRKSIYRTLLVMDIDLVQRSAHSVSFFAEEFRGTEDNPSNKRRIEVENHLAEVAEAGNGEVIIYCPSPNMQAKEVDVRLEIVENRVLPLRLQKELFSYYSDLKVIEQYYQDLWRLYIFVSPPIFEVMEKCQEIVDEFCSIYQIDRFIAYNKVRHHDMKYQEVSMSKVVQPLRRFLEGLHYSDVPKSIITNLMQKMGNDGLYIKAVKDRTDLAIEQRLNRLFNITVLEEHWKESGVDSSTKKAITKYIKALNSGEVEAERREAARAVKNLLDITYENYKNSLVDQAISYSKKKKK